MLYPVCSYGSDLRNTAWCCHNCSALWRRIERAWPLFRRLRCCGVLWRGGPSCRACFFWDFLVVCCIAVLLCSRKKKENPAKDLETMSNGITPFKLFLHKVVPSAYSHLIPVACVVVSL